MVRFLFLTALLLILRISLVGQTGQCSFFQLGYSVPSYNQVNAIWKDTDGRVWFGVMRGSIVITDIDISFFTSNMMMLPGSGANGNFAETRANFCPC